MIMKTSPLEYEFVGPFSQLLINFIEFKTAQGYKYIGQGLILSRFSRFSCGYLIENNELTKELVEDWHNKYSHVKPTTLSHMLFPIRDFALYLGELGYKAYLPIFPKLPAKSFIPHIFSQDELIRFFHWCDSMNYKVRPDSTIELVFPVLFRVLLGCGLRISEALNLKVRDVDLVNGILTIFNGKGNKDRLVVMSPSLNKICMMYNSIMHLKASPADYFFCRKSRRRYSYSNIFDHYKRILEASEIMHRIGGYGPRIHDFRHTFAVLSMRQNHSEGVDMNYFMPVLSTYLGHDNVYETEKYIHLPSEFHSEVRDIISEGTDFVIPEVLR